MLKFSQIFNFFRPKTIFSLEEKIFYVISWMAILSLVTAIPNLIRKCGGFMDIQSKENQGTTVTLHFPMNIIARQSQNYTKKYS